MTLRAALVLLLALAFAASPLFSTFNGFDPDLYPVPQENPPVQPAGYAFAIWGLIYLWLIVHAAWGLVRRRDDPAWDRIRLPLMVSLAAGVPWLMVAERSPVAATALIWVMLLAALAALSRTTTAEDRWVLAPPVAIYAGWLTAASSVSVGLLLAGYGITGEVAAAWIGLALAAALAVVVQVRLGRAPEYGLAVAWAAVAVMVRNLGSDTGLALAAGFLAAIMVGLAFSALAGERMVRRHWSGSSSA